MAIDDVWGEAQWLTPFSRRQSVTTISPDFYRFYLTEHANQTCRRLHFVGSTLALVCLVMFVLTGDPVWLVYGLFSGYGFAWIGHFAFEKNRPASFKQPLYSFMGDWTMYWQILMGRIRF